MGSPTEMAAFAKQFAEQYYQTFDTNRPGLANFYSDQSSLCFETQDPSQQIVGRTNIAEKLTSLPFQSVKHAITTVDAQLTVDGGLLVVVNGQLQTDNDPKMPFSQTFYLKQMGESFFVLNDIFRLGVHNF